MTGTWVNVGGLVAGSLLGLLLKRGIPEKLNEALMRIQGFVVAIIGLNGVIGAMFTVDLQTGKLSDSGILLLLISLTLGCLAGELIRIDDHLGTLGRFVERKMGTGDFAKGFVTGSLLFSIGAMGIIGSINEGLTGDSSVLLVKATIDFVLSVVLASALGVGVLFSFLPVLAVQGAVTLLAAQVAPLISDRLLDLFCMVGYSIVTVLGINLIHDTKIKVANLLPSLIVPIVYYFVLVV